MSLPKIKFFTLTSLIALLSIFQTSYHSCVINIPQPLFLQFINDTYYNRYGHQISDTVLDAQWAWIVSILYVGALIGSLITPFLSEKLGRKLTFMILANLLAIGGSLIASFSFMAHSYEMLGVGRLFIGIAVGINSVVVPLYLNECSTTEHRGVMGVIQNLFLNFLNLFAFLVALPEAWGTKKALPILMGLGIVPAVIQISISFFLMESPKYLYINRKDKVEAEKSLQYWNDGPEKTKEQIESIFKEFDMEAATLEQEVGLFRALKIPYFRRVLIIGLVIMICQAATGISAVISYSSDMFTKLGFSTLITNICTIIIPVIGTLASLISAPFIEKYSRRSMYFSSYFILVIVLLLYTIFFIIYDQTSQTWSAYTALACMFVFAFVINTGAFELTLVIPFELSPQAIRSGVNSAALTLSWVLSLVITFAYPPVWHSLGSISYFFFIVPLVAGLAYLYKVMPETAGKSIGEIVQENLGDSGKKINIGEKVSAQEKV